MIIHLDDKNIDVEFPDSIPKEKVIAAIKAKFYSTPKETEQSQQAPKQTEIPEQSQKTSEQTQPQQTQVPTQLESQQIVPTQVPTQPQQTQVPTQPQLVTPSDKTETIIDKTKDYATKVGGRLAAGAINVATELNKLIGLGAFSATKKAFITNPETTIHQIRKATRSDTFIGKQTNKLLEGFGGLAVDIPVTIAIGAVTKTLAASTILGETLNGIQDFIVGSGVKTGVSEYKKNPEIKNLPHVINKTLESMNVSALFTGETGKTGDALKRHLEKVKNRGVIKRFFNDVIKFAGITTAQQTYDTGKLPTGEDLIDNTTQAIGMAAAFTMIPVIQKHTSNSKEKLALKKYKKALDKAVKNEDPSAVEKVFNDFAADSNITEESKKAVINIMKKSAEESPQAEESLQAEEPPQTVQPVELKDKKQQEFVDKKVKELGSLEAVKKEYFNDDPISNYARQKAAEIYGGEPEEVKSPKEVTVKQDEFGYDVIGKAKKPDGSIVPFAKEWIAKKKIANLAMKNGISRDNYTILNYDDGYVVQRIKPKTEEPKNKINEEPKSKTNEEPKSKTNEESLLTNEELDYLNPSKDKTKSKLQKPEEVANKKEKEKIKKAEINKIGSQVAESINKNSDHQLKFDGEFDLSALGKPSEYQFTPQAGKLKGRTFTVKNLDVETVQKALDTMKPTKKSTKRTVIIEKDKTKTEPTTANIEPTLAKFGKPGYKNGELVPWEKKTDAQNVVNAIGKGWEVVPHESGWIIQEKPKVKTAETTEPTELTESTDTVKNKDVILRKKKSTEPKISRKEFEKIAPIWHGTSKKAAKLIEENGLKEGGTKENGVKGAKAHHYTYSQFGYNTLYASNEGLNKTWLNKEWASKSRAVPYETAVPLIFKDPKKVVVIKNQKDADTIAQKAGFKDMSDAEEQLWFDGYDIDTTTKESKERAFKERIEPSLKAKQKFLDIGVDVLDIRSPIDVTDPQVVIFNPDAVLTYKQATEQTPTKNNAEKPKIATAIHHESSEISTELTQEEQKPIINQQGKPGYKKGKIVPWKREFYAKKAAEKAGKGWEVVPHESGWIIQEKPKTEQLKTEPEQTEPEQIKKEKELTDAEKEALLYAKSMGAKVELPESKTSKEKLSALQEELKELTKKKEINQRRLDTTSGEAKAQSVQFDKLLQQKIDSVNKQIKEIKETSTSNSVTLNVGIDPIQAAKEIKALINDTAKMLPKLHELGKHYYTGAKQKYFDWQKSMKSALKDVWNKVKPYIADVWKKLKKGTDTLTAPISNEHGTTLFAAKTKTEKIISDKIVDKKSGKVKIPGKFRRSLTDVKETVDKYLAPMSTELENISPAIKNRMVAFELDSNIKREKIKKLVLPFIKATKKMSKRDYKLYNTARMNSDIETIEKLNKKYSKYNLGKEYAKVRSVLDVLRDESVKVGYEVNYKQNYHPREITDQRGLSDYLHKTGDWSIIELALKAKEKAIGEHLTKEQEIKFLNKLFRGYEDSKVSLSKPGQLKLRKIQTVTPELEQFYGDSNSALLRYIDSVVDKIEAKKLFGAHKDIDINQTIGRYVRDLAKNKDITPSQAFTLIALMKARFNPKAASNVTNAYRNFSYIDIMGGIDAAITQVQDIAWSLYENGIVKTTKATPNALLRKSRFTKESLGLSKIGTEFSDNTKLNKLVNFTFKLNGLTTADDFGKELLINSSYDSAVSKARKQPEKFKRELKPIFGEATDKLIKDFKEKKDSRDVRLYLLHKLSNYQPVTKLELPRGYYESGILKTAYFAKSFDIKRFDTYRREIFQKIAKKETRAQGIKNLIRLTTYMALMGATADTIKDILFNRPVNLTKSVLQNMAAVAISKYRSSRVEKEGFGKGIVEQVTPPTKFIDELSKDIFSRLTYYTTNDQGKKIAAKNSIDKGLHITKSIPLIGKVYYSRYGRGTNYIQKLHKQARKEAYISKYKRHTNAVRNLTKRKTTKRKTVYR